jgi:uncharacterized protein YeaO (DUF488 family)
MNKNRNSVLLRLKRKTSRGGFAATPSEREQAMDIRLKRVYDQPAADDGYRILVDRVWPRGIRKEDLRLDEWLKEIAPSSALRKWFGHDPEKWPRFVERYSRELEEQHGPQVKRLAAIAADGRLTLVFGASDRQHNNAMALMEYLRHPRG